LANNIKRDEYMPFTVRRFLKQGLIKDSITQHTATSTEMSTRTPTATPTLTIDSIQQTLEQQKTLPREEKDYIYSYFLLEKYALQQNSALTKQDIRNDIKTKFNVEWFSPKITALFKLKNPDQLIFTELILEAILKSLVKKMGAAPLQRILTEITKDKLGMHITVNKNNVDLSNLEKHMYADEQHLEPFTNSINQIIKAVYNYSRNNLGASATENLFSESFQQLKRKYYSFLDFQTAVKALPEGILERERLDLLTKEELENVSKRLKQVDTMKSEFANIAAHELKTPLVPIIGFLNMMAEKPEKYGLSEKAKGYVDTCLRNSKRLERLVQDILDISKLDAGEMKFQMKKLNLVPFLKNSLQDLSFMAKEKKISLKSTIPEKLPTIRGDAQRLTQVIENLVKNAIKFTDKGSVSMKVFVKNNQIQVDVTDTGMGIAKENIPKLFTKFFQTEHASTRKTKGTGLGLAISKKIIEAHQGKIWVNSVEKKGSTFSFSLPTTPTKVH
jgi:signal transduction histidine kinase